LAKKPRRRQLRQVVWDQEKVRETILHGQNEGGTRKRSGSRQHKSKVVGRGGKKQREIGIKEIELQNCLVIG